MLRIPPERLISIAVIPLVTPAKSPLMIVIKNAYPDPAQLAMNIVTMLESPGFAPGGKPG